MSAGNFLHAAGIDNVLLEGNVSPGLNPDGVHGTSNFVTAFRNYFLGTDTSRNQQTMPVLMQGYNRYFNLIGNVLGTPGYHTVYECAAASANDTCSTSPNTSIYTIGYSGNQGQYGGVFPNDPLSKTTTMRWGNYDTVNGAVRWQSTEVPSGLSQFANPLPASHTLPASFYISAKPSWWSSGKPWPAIGPDVSSGNIANLGGHANTIPAQDCYASMGGPADGTGGVLNFNASTCYSQSVQTTVQPPTALTTAVH
jgi:hypothetical protein